MPSISSGYFGSSPAVMWTISWEFGSPTWTVTATKDSGTRFTGGGWTVSISLGNGTRASVYIAAKTNDYTACSWSTTVNVSPLPESATSVSVNVTSTNFTSSGVGSFSGTYNPSWSIVTTGSYSNLSSTQTRALNIQQYGVDRVAVTFTYSGSAKVYTSGGTVSDTYGYVGTSAAGVNSGTGAPTSYLYSNDDGGEGYHYQIIWEATAGTTYYIYTRGLYSDTSGSTTLYIVPPPRSVTVNYYKNDTLGTVINMPASGKIAVGSQISSLRPSKQYIITLNASGGECDFESVTATIAFTHWNTNASGTGTTYAAGSTYNGTTTLNLYAIWSEDVPSIALPTPTRSGYRFMGWALSADSTSGVTGSYTPSQSITLYAIWQRQGAIHIYTSDGEYASFMVWIYRGDGGGPNGNGWYRAVPKIYCTANGVTKFHSCG